MLNGWTARSWAVSRGLLGAYLLVHFVGLWPWAPEIFSAAGMDTAAVSPLFRLVPSLLWISQSPAMVWTLVALGIAGSVGILLGTRDRAGAGLVLWVLASLFVANPLINNPSLAHVGWILLAHVLIPAAPSLPTLARDPEAGRDWTLPPAVFAAGWVVMAVAYGYSGFTKLVSPSWTDGTALIGVLENPLARPTFLRIWLLEHPVLLVTGTWIALGLELSTPLLALSRRLRPVLWGALLILQLGLLILVDFADLTWGMLVLQAWTFDPAWLPSVIPTGGSEPRRSHRSVGSAG